MPHVAHALQHRSREMYEVYETPERARAQALRSAGEGRLGDALVALTSAWSDEQNRAQFVPGARDEDVANLLDGLDATSVNSIPELDVRSLRVAPSSFKTLFCDSRSSSLARNRSDWFR